MQACQTQPIKPSEITPRHLFESRRKFMRMAGGAVLATFWPSQSWAGASLTNYRKSDDPLALELTPFRDITQYNNFYEFGTSKDDPVANAESLQTRPWSVKLTGEVKKPRSFDIDEILQLAPLEERIYRLRCVEAWSMVVPWIGFPLSELLKKVEPTGNAQYVEFISLHDAAQMSGQRRQVLDWPYREGLRIDEAMHPLTLLTVGLYGEVLPKQNGAPVRVVVPWKYGFKSAKSIVEIRLTDRQPLTSWMKVGPDSYGFYANVNPEVDHPRWSQAKERRIGEFFKRKTLPFNGYAEQVASLYSGMDLTRNF